MTREHGPASDVILNVDVDDEADEADEPTIETGETTLAVDPMDESERIDRISSRIIGAIEGVLDRMNREWFGISATIEAHERNVHYHITKDDPQSSIGTLALEMARVVERNAVYSIEISITPVSVIDMESTTITVGEVER